MQNTVMNISSTVGKVQRAAVNDQSSLFSTLNKRKLGTRLPTGSFRSSSALSPASSKSNIYTLSGHQTTASTHPSIKAKRKEKKRKCTHSKSSGNQMLRMSEPIDQHLLFVSSTFTQSLQTTNMNR